MKLLIALLPFFVALQDGGWKATPKAREVSEELKKKHTEADGFKHDAFGYIAHACKTSDADFKRANRFLRTYADWAAKHLFETKPEILRVVSFSRTADFRDFSGGRGSAGFYRHSARMLVNNLQTGLGTAGHEMTHALMYADWKNGSPNPWFREGFAAMMENSLRKKDGTFIGPGYSHWRFVRGVRPAIANGSLPALRDTFQEKRARSMHYAVGRWVLTYLWHRGLLKNFHDEFRATAGRDASGITAFEKTVGKKLEEFEKEWIDWSKDLESEISTIQGGGGFPVLGIIARNKTSGVTIAGVAPNSTADFVLQEGDVILKADEKDVKTMEDLLNVLRAKKRGDKIRIDYRRKGKENWVRVTLEQYIG